MIKAKISGGLSHPVLQWSCATHSGPIRQLRSALGRDLTQFESDMLVYPRLCNVCLDGRQESTLSNLHTPLRSWKCRGFMDAASSNLNPESRDIKILAVVVRTETPVAHMNEIISFRRVIILDEILPHLEFRKSSRTRLEEDR